MHPHAPQRQISSTSSPNPLQLPHSTHLGTRACAQHYLLTTRPSRPSLPISYALYLHAHTIETTSSHPNLHPSAHPPTKKNRKAKKSRIQTAKSLASMPGYPIQATSQTAHPPLSTIHWGYGAHCAMSSETRRASLTLRTRAQS